MKEKTTKNLAWNTFKKTGNINTFMELMQVENLEKGNQTKQNNTINTSEYFNIDSK